MRFKVILYEHEEGFTVFCPMLRGCVSEGATEEKAMENIQSAIREYLEAVWVMTKREIADDQAEGYKLVVTYREADVDVEGVEDAEADEVEAVV